MEQKIAFNSGGDTCRGWLLTPETGPGPFPTLIMAGGWCYTKEIVMPHYAQYFLQAGVACLLFDYRRFGESDGEPRQHLDPWEQIEDYRNALSFAATRDDVDMERLQRLSEDRERRFQGHPSDLIPMSTTDPDHELSAWPFPHVCTIFNEIRAREAPRHIHANTVESIELLLAYQVRPYAARITETPVMLAIAGGDNITSADLEIDAFNAIPCPQKELAIVTGVDHMSLYANTDHLAKVATRQVAWLQRLLALESPAAVLSAG